MADVIQELLTETRELRRTLNDPDVGLIVKIDRIHQAVTAGIPAHEKRLTRLERFQSRALAAWGIIVAITAAVASLAWQWLGDKAIHRP